MKCPNCGSREGVELNSHSEGFTSSESPVKECRKCGLVWRLVALGNETEIDIIKSVDLEPDFTESFFV